MNTEARINTTRNGRFYSLLVYCAVELQPLLCHSKSIAPTVQKWGLCESRRPVAEELTTSQAARAYETHPNVLNRLILTGRLQARKNASGGWLIQKKSLDNWHGTRRKRGGSALVRALVADRRTARESEKGSGAEHVRQPRDGELVKALRAGPPSRPSNDAWRTETEEPTKSLS
jgi:hypothetical protein